MTCGFPFFFFHRQSPDVVFDLKAGQTRKVLISATNEYHLSNTEYSGPGGAAVKCSCLYFFSSGF